MFENLSQSSNEVLRSSRTTAVGWVSMKPPALLAIESATRKLALNIVEISARICGGRARLGYDGALCI